MPKNFFCIKKPFHTGYAELLPIMKWFPATFNG